MLRLLAVMLLGLISVSSAFAAEQAAPLRVGMVTWFGNGMAFVAKDQGFFDKTDVDVKVIDDITVLFNSFRSNQIDIASFTSDGAALQYASGMTGKVILLTDYSFGGDGLIADNAITDTKQLKGKTVGFTRAFASHYLLGKILQQAGLSMNDIKQAPFDDPGLAAQGLFSGKVDAAVTWEPFLTQARTKKLGSVIKTTRDFPNALPNIFMVTEKALKEHPEQVKDFIIGMTKAMALAKAEPEKVVPMIAKGFNLSIDETKQGQNGSNIVDKEQNYSFFCTDKPEFSTVYDDSAQFWIDQKIITKKPFTGKEVISNIGCDVFHEKR